ncbi:MAG TPA: DUF1801 domain-containing protein [Ignavibacteria bacterium]|nr:DUF1801 domain-containing protein [Ignavibacteria bacterium]HMQ99470.1 DUF1801 domain-containing protein [Ignavibacteria bacterium]
MGKLAEIKTKQTELSVEDFINSVKDEQKRKDSLTLLKIYKKISGEKPKIWGSSIIGFGKKVYKSPATGREVEWFKLGFSPRKANISLQLVIDVRKHSDILKKFGKHKAGVGCLYINKLADIDMKVLEKLVKEAAKGK